MPTVLRVGPYRCFFYAGDRAELARIVLLVQEHAADLQRSWDDYFTD